MPAVKTRERILDEAMRLFSQQGFKATTIVQIETAAGLAPGSGSLYHHFGSKDAILAAGIERHLERLDALRDIRHLFVDLGDLAIELRITARYVLTELTREAELLQLLITEARNRPELLTHAAEQLIGATLDGFAGWLLARSEREISSERAHALASLALGGLVSNRLLQSTLGLTPRVDDELLVETWVDLVLPALEPQGAEPAGQQ